MSDHIDISGAAVFEYTDERGIVRFRTSIPEGAQIYTCAYCRHAFVPSRSHAKVCSGACRVALHRALKAQYIDPPSLRTDHFSAERKSATGFGLITASEAVQLDQQARRDAGLDQE